MGSRTFRLGVAPVVLTALLLGTIAGCTAPEVVPTPSPTETTVAPPPRELQGNETLALEDLRSCLAVNPVLNVFYLIDNSGSLLETDPEKLRVRTLASSLGSLSSLGAEVNINWAAGSFDSGYTPLVGWSVLQGRDDGVRFSAAIPTDGTGDTNWEAGIEGASASLREQNANTPGCSMLIWFTDGQIDVDGVTGPQTNDSANRLCGAKLRSGARVGVSPGILQQLRSDQVVVFGVLLNKTGNILAKRELVAIVEGVPDSEDGITELCGEVSGIDVHGTVAVVEEANDLAAIFDRLPLVIQGGQSEQIGADGTFFAPAGVSRFVIQFAGGARDWVLKPPRGDNVGAADLAPPSGISVTAGGAQLDVTINDPSFNGEWTLMDPQVGDELFRFSGLTIDINDFEGANLGIVEGAPSLLSGTLVGPDGNPAVLTPYDFDWVVEQRIAGQAQSQPLTSEAEIDGKSHFDINLSSTTASAGDTVRLVVGLRNLRTKDGNVALAAPSASVFLTVVPTSSVPSKITLDFSTPATYSTDPAVGRISATPPEGGESVGVRVSSDSFTVTNDRFGREFELTQSGTECAPDVLVCGELGAEVPLAVGLKPEERAQYSSVEVEMLVELTVPQKEDGAVDSKEGSTAEVRVFQKLTAELQTTRPISPWLLAAVLLVLLALGITIPVLLAWLLKRALVWIHHGRSVQRAEFPARIEEGKLICELDTTDDAVLSKAFLNQPSQDRVRDLTDSVLGKMRIQVPISPLAPAWFAVYPPHGAQVFTKHSGGSSRSKAADISAGRLFTFDGVLGHVWGFVASANDIAGASSTAPIPGVLVVYTEPRVGQKGQYAARMRDILATTDWRAAAADLRRRAAESMRSGGSDAAHDAPDRTSPDAGAGPINPPGRLLGDADPAQMPDPRPPGRSAPGRPATPPGRPNSAAGIQLPTDTNARPPGRSGDANPSTSLPRPPGR